MKRDLTLFVVLAALFGAGQVVCFDAFEVNKQIGLALGHLFLLWVGVVFVRPRSNWRFVLYLGGYALLFLLLHGYGHKQLLLILFAFVYAATFHTPLLFGYFLIFVFSYVLFPVYAFAEFVLGILVYTVIYSIAKGRHGFFLTGSFLWGSVLLAFLLLPLLHLVSQSTPQEVARSWSGSAYSDDAAQPKNEVREAIWRSVKTSTIATLLIGLFGIPFAYAMARADFTGKSLLVTLIDIPIIIPQPIVAIALLQFLGDKSTLGSWLYEVFDIRFSGAEPGIIAVQIFVSSPFLIRSALAAFQEVDPKLERVARTLGATASQAFRMVALPLASRGVLVGLILAWARGVSEFGSVLILAENPETAPVMVYHLFIRHGIQQQTLPAVVLLILVCAWWFIGLHLIRTAWGGGLLGGDRRGQPDSD